MPVLSEPALILQQAGTTSEKVAEVLGVHSSTIAAYFAGRTRPHPRLISVVESLTDPETARAVDEAIKRGPIRDRVRSERVAQGKPATVTDPDALARIAAAVSSRGEAAR